MLVVLQLISIPDDLPVCELRVGVAVVGARVTASADWDLEQGYYRVM